MLRRVMIIGSGPIVIGQAAEFDYAGSQACKALREAGLEVILINPNPATIMTDHASAAKIYIEPLTLEVIKRIIIAEKPDGLLSTLGGQSGLTLSMQLAKEGFLDLHHVQLLGANCETIEKAEDRLLFKQAMQDIGEPCAASGIAENLPDALIRAEDIGYPVIVRPAYTLGGTGGGICTDAAELEAVASAGLRLSPIGQILIEKSISGWKEIEFEVIRDATGSVAAVCSMENIDPVGVHTGDSIVVAPALTLTVNEMKTLRDAALRIVSALKVEGGCNCQFALRPDGGQYAVIEVNPRVSRSSALASKATGYPIAKTASLIAVGYTLLELRNSMTGITLEAFEPSLDYVVVKFPKWPFDKFIYGRRVLGTQMKATGEVMAIGVNLEQALMKAVRGAEIGVDTLRMDKMAALSHEDLFTLIASCTDERLFAVYEALRRDECCVDKLCQTTQMDAFFINKLLRLVRMEKKLEECQLNEACYREAKQLGFPDSAITRLTGVPVASPRLPVYKAVDTCAAEFEAGASYFYATYDEENEAGPPVAADGQRKPVVIVLGAGPIRIGQGIEFDYASVHCVRVLKKLGYDSVMINNNPETVSTDFDTADRLYFEPLTAEDVLSVIAVEKPMGVVAAFGGQTAIKLTKPLHHAGVKILGTSADSIDLAEDRKRFDSAMERLGIKRPRGSAVMTAEDAITVANELGYPVLVRPSYVLGGQNMIIADRDEDIQEYMQIILAGGIENPILIDQYLQGVEVEVDAICDGEDILIPGIMEHIERAGVHSGDSIAVYPAWNLSGFVAQRIIGATRSIALELLTVGLVNIQYVIFHNEIYVIEANPRASRTIPYISKVTGVPMVDLAVRAMMGEKLSEMGYGTGLYKQSPYYAVKVPAFSFEKLQDVDTHLGPEMKSTGEALGIGSTLEEAMYKGLVAAGFGMRRDGGMFMTVCDADKAEVVDTARRYLSLGLSLYATPGTAQVLVNHGLSAAVVRREMVENMLSLGNIRYILSTSSKGRATDRISVKIRRTALERAIPVFTSLDTANALANALISGYTQSSIELVDINHMRKDRQSLRFIKMRGTGNDYIFFDCFNQQVISPSSLSVQLSDRRKSIGGEGIILIEPSSCADAYMRVFNADGSESQMAGNAIRCVAKYLYESGRVQDTCMTIQTKAGLRKLNLFLRDDVVISVQVDMGVPIFSPSDIPVLLDGKRAVNRVMRLAGEDRTVTCLSMGNPHVVQFVQDASRVRLPVLGPAIENDRQFPERVNVSFATLLNRNVLKARVWERGIGETWGCGTGACAIAVAAVECGLCDKDTYITVRLIGGELVIRYAKDGHVFMSGDVRKDYAGVVEV